MIYLLNQLVEAAADRDPERRAVVCRDQSLTYEQLYARSCSLANALFELGVRKGDRVGIYLGKSVDAVVALHGIMMAGAAYVPLDPKSPTSRLRFVIDDCGIEHLVTEDRRRGQIEEMITQGAGLETLIGVTEAIAGVESYSWSELSPAGHPPSSGVTEQDLSYILYTSGSTGVPKGIMHTHRSALSWANVTAMVYDITGEDVISNYAPLHFDLSTLDLFGGARGGATMVMIPEEHMAFPASLASLLEAERLTLFYTVPMALVQLAAPGVIDGRDLSSLSRILFGGEPMPPKHLRRLMERLAHTRFFNVYGPTEVNGVTHHEVTDPPEEDGEPLPIGHPYPNVDARVVDEDGRPVEPGEVGELLIRSPTMMRGYWGRPDLNEGAFVYENRFEGIPDVFHKTGDLVSEGQDGLLRFHGRRDRQVKARGYRVELDDIEAVLVSHPDVIEGAVFPVADEDGAVTIHAAAILDEDSRSDVAEIRRFLAASLPSYALPETITITTDFPRTTSGKIDRRRLAFDQVGAPVEAVG